MDTALAQLEDRFRHFGGRSAQPALTRLGMREIEQPEKARSILSEAIQLRPDDGYLIIRAASLNARLGAREQADTLLNQAKGKVRDNDWLRTAAEIAEVRFDAKGHLQFSREILALEPLAWMLTVVLPDHWHNYKVARVQWRTSRMPAHGIRTIVDFNVY